MSNLLRVLMRLVVYYCRMYFPSRFAPGGPIANDVSSSELEKLHPSLFIREVVFDIFRLCGWLIREFGLPRLSPYQRSPPEPNKEVSSIVALAAWYLHRS
jgi:hypothetical protein